MNHIWKHLPVLGIVISSLALGSSASAQMLETRVVVDSLSTPWEIAWGIDGWIWMTERGGSDQSGGPVVGDVDTAHPDSRRRRGR